MKQAFKRAWTILAAAALVSGSCQIASLASGSADVNGSGTADKYDAYALRDALLGKGEMNEAMDVDGDRKVNAKDLSILKRMLMNPPQTGDDFPKPDLPATMYSNFDAGEAGDFFASQGWTNGWPFDCWWYEQNAQIKGDHLELVISDNYENKTNPDWNCQYSGGEFRTNKYYSYGYYEVCMKAIKNDGVVSSFFTYTGPSDEINGVKNPWDEIDIEILGKDTTKMQCNYYRDSKGGHEKMVDLGFDASEAYHKYGFDWQPDHITWYVDGREVCKMTGDMPVTASKIMMNAWPGRNKEGQHDISDWLNYYNGNKPLVASYKWVTYKQADNAKPPRTMSELESGW